IFQNLTQVFARSGRTTQSRCESLGLVSELRFERMIGFLCAVRTLSQENVGPVRKWTLQTAQVLKIWGELGGCGSLAWNICDERGGLGVADGKAPVPGVGFDSLGRGVKRDAWDGLAWE